MGRGVGKGSGGGRTVELDLVGLVEPELRVRGLSRSYKKDTLGDGIRLILLP